MHNSTGNVACGKSAVRYALALPIPFSLPLSLSSLPASISYYRLPLLPVSDIVKLDVPVGRVGGHDDPPGLELGQTTKKMTRFLDDFDEEAGCSGIAVSPPR